MRIVVAVLLLIIMALPVAAADASRPIVLVFETSTGEGMEKGLASSSTKALRTYLRETQRVEAVIFNRESPTVLRAIMDKQLTADQVASYSSQQERILVARALSYEYAAGSEVTIKDTMIEVKVWLAKSNGAKKDKWEATSQSLTGGTGTLNNDNAMQSSTSAAVINIARQAFAALAPVADKQPDSPADTTVIGADQVAPPAPPSAGDYTSQADANLQAGNLALAIQQYQQAVNADSSNTALRIKLVDAYARKGMYDEAAAELDRAAAMGANADQVVAATNNIERLKSGQGTTKPIPAAGSAEPRVDSVTTGREQPKVDTPPGANPKSAVAKIKAGDKLWRENQPDEAAEAYRESIKLDSSDWRAYERLALVDASMSLFSESRTTLEQLAKVQPDPSPQIISNRYELFNQVFERWFTALFKQYDGDSADYAKHIISRESYYSSMKSLGLRLESMAKFLDALSVPKDKQPANIHRSLACGLVSEAASSLLDYLETNNSDSKANAETFVVQAKKELETAAKLAPPKPATNE